MKNNLIYSIIVKLGDIELAQIPIHQCGHPIQQRATAFELIKQNPLMFLPDYLHHLKDQLSYGIVFYINNSRLNLFGGNKSKIELDINTEFEARLFEEMPGTVANVEIEKIPSYADNRKTIKAVKHIPELATGLKEILYKTV